MPIAVACPSSEKLIQLGLSSHTDGESDALLAHLESCSQCATRLRTLQADDSLVDAVRQSSTVSDQGADDTEQRLIGTCRVLAGAPAADESNPTAAFSTPSSETR